METKVGPYFKHEQDSSLEERQKYQLFITLIVRNAKSINHDVDYEELKKHTRYAVQDKGYQFSEEVFEENLKLLLAIGRIKEIDGLYY